jgi:hypothetical protein
MIFMIEVLLFALQTPTLGAFRAPATSSRSNKAQRGKGAAKQEGTVKIFRRPEVECYAMLIRSPFPGIEKPLWRCDGDRDQNGCGGSERPGRRPVRRRYLLSTVSRRVLLCGKPARDPAIEMVAQVVRAISSLLTQQNLVGFDFRDARAILENGGQAVFAEGYSVNPRQRRQELQL